MHKMCPVSLIKFMINQLFLGMFYNFELQTLWPHELKGTSAAAAS